MRFPQFSDEVSAWYVQRLESAIDHFCKGSAEAFARMIDWPTGGGMVRQIKLKKRPMQRSVLARIERSENPALRAWFELPPELKEAASSSTEVVEVLTPEVQEGLRKLSPEMQLVAENQLRALVGLQPLPAPSRKQTGT